MKNNKTKLLVILLVVLLVIVALVGTVVAMVFTGKLALTDKQKLAKGLNDIKTRFSSVYSGEDNIIQEYEKMYTTPFESQTTITGSINKLDIEGTEGMEQILSEIKEIVGETKITNSVQADLKNKVVNENLKVEMGDVVDEISLDLEYNNDTIALRSKELNEKYLSITKNDVESNSEYEDLVEVFEMFDMLCEKIDTQKMTFTEEEKLHFQENYKGIFDKYLTDDMITSAEANITVEGQSKKCSAVTVTFNKTQIQAILGEYLNRFENDATGKNILLNKLTYFSEEVTEQDLLDLIEDLRSDLEDLEDDIKVVFTLYCDNFKTYGFDIVFADSIEASTIKTVLETNAINVKLISSETEIGMTTATETELGTITISGNEINIVIKDEDASMTLNAKEENNKTNASIAFSSEDAVLGLQLTNEQVTNTETETAEKNSVRLVLKSEEVNIDVTLNLDSNLKYINSVSTTSTSDNSLNMITGATTDLQQYITDAMPKAQVMLQTAQENSIIVKALISSLQTVEEEVDETINEVEDITSSQVVQSFNAIYESYAGVAKGSSVKALLQTVANNNQTNTRKITINLVTDTGVSVTAVPEDIVGLMNNISGGSEYTVSVRQFDAEGYITSIEIQKYQ